MGSRARRGLAACLASHGGGRESIIENQVLRVNSWVFRMADSLVIKSEWIDGILPHVNLRYCKDKLLPEPLDAGTRWSGPGLHVEGYLLDYRQRREMHTLSRPKSP
jgi:hypothetical protein